MHGPSFTGDGPAALRALADECGSLSHLVDVCFWHIADMAITPSDVRFWGYYHLTDC